MSFTKQLKGYESEMTLLIREMKAKNPAIEADQRAGRAVLWDKAPVELDQQARDRDSSVARQSYVYQNKIG
ncbi:MAG: DUF3460 family protein [Pseudomonadota bacterium]